MSDQIEVDPLEANELSEVDHLKAQLLNRDMDLIVLQRELIATKHKEVNNNLTMFSAEIVQRYGLESAQQVDVSTGKINRTSTGDPNADA